MRREDRPPGDPEARSTDPIVYALEDVHDVRSSAVPYERVVQMARADLGLTRSEATSSIERRVEEGHIEKVRADRLRPR